MATLRREKKQEDAEQRPLQEDGRRKMSETRQRIPVSHLAISMAASDQGSKKRLLIKGDIDAVTIRTILAIIKSEITGLAVSIVVAAVWRSAWMVLWLAPLLLKLMAACFAVPRYPYTLETPSEEPPKASFFLESGQEIQIIEGPVHIVRPFFRHYGHP